MNKTQTENVVCVYGEDGQLKAIVKGDQTNNSTRKIIYTVEEASVEDITDLINPDKTLI